MPMRGLLQPGLLLATCLILAAPAGAQSLSVGPPAGDDARPLALGLPRGLSFAPPPDGSPNGEPQLEIVRVEARPLRAAHARRSHQVLGSISIALGELPAIMAALGGRTAMEPPQSVYWRAVVGGLAGYYARHLLDWLADRLGRPR